MYFYPSAFPTSVSLLPPAPGCSSACLTSVCGERRVTIIHRERTPQSQTDRSKDVVDRWGSGGWGDECSLSAGYRFSLSPEVLVTQRSFHFFPAGSDGCFVRLTVYFPNHVLKNKSAFDRALLKPLLGISLTPSCFLVATPPPSGDNPHRCPIKCTTRAH